MILCASLCFGIGYGFAQSCTSVTIVEDSAGIDISVPSAPTGRRVTCIVPFVILKANVFAPGGSTDYIAETIDFAECPSTWAPTVGINPGDALDFASELTGDDQWSTPLSIDVNGYPQAPGTPFFQFSFFGNTYNTIQLNTNGEISFDFSHAWYSNCGYTINANDAIPTTNSNIHRNVIMTPYHDIWFGPSYPNAHCYYRTIGYYPCRKFVVIFANSPMFSCTSLIVNHMCVLYEMTNTIEFYIKDKPSCTAWQGGRTILGIHNADGTQACVIPGHNATAWEEYNTAYRIRPQGNLHSVCQWSRKTQNDVAYVPIVSLDTIRCKAAPTIEDGPTWYKCEATIYMETGDPIPVVVDSVLVYPPNTPPLSVSHNGNTGAFDTICLGDSINIQLEGRSFYKIISPIEVDIPSTQDTGRISLFPMGDITYILEGYNLDISGDTVCPFYDTLNVNVRSYEISLGNNDTICAGDSIKLFNLNSDYTGLCTWTTGFTGDTLAIPLQTSADIGLTMQDGWGCLASDTVHIEVHNPPSVSFSGTQAICPQTSTTLSVTSNPVNCLYDWGTLGTSNSISVSPTADTTWYVVSVKRPPAMCETIDSVFVAILPAPVISITPDQTICESESVVIDVNGAASRFEWQTAPTDVHVQGSSATHITVSPQNSTRYTIHAWNDIGCESVEATNVFIEPRPIARIAYNPTTIDELDPIILFYDSSQGNMTRAWSISDGTTTQEQNFSHQFDVTNDDEFDISLLVATSAGCLDSTQTTIRVFRQHSVFAPTAIYTHDNNIANRTFRLYIDRLSEYNLTIYNRWGTIVFQTNNINQAWDATFNGKPVPQGSYVWIAKYRLTTEKNRLYEKTGQVMVMD
jgi:gliding motility-associated-like protein